MKIRNGFVSNSSSSSFLIYGTFCDEHDKLSFTDELVERYATSEKISFEEAKDILDEKSSYYICNFICSLLGSDFVADGISGYDAIWLGRPWDSVKDDETGLQFKQSIEKSISKYLFNVKFDTFQEAWYDG